MSTQPIPEMSPRTTHPLGDSWVVESDEGKPLFSSASITGSSSSSDSMYAAASRQLQTSQKPKMKPAKRSLRKTAESNAGTNFVAQNGNIPSSSITSGATVSEASISIPNRSLEESQVAVELRGGTRTKITKKTRATLDRSDDNEDDAAKFMLTKSRRSKPAVATATSHKLLHSLESPRRRPTRAASRASAEPDLIMPSIHEDILGGSWMGEEKPIRVRRDDDTTSELLRKSHRTRTSKSAQRQSSRTQEFSKSSSEYLSQFLMSTLNWAHGVFGGTLNIIKRPLSYMIAVLLLLLLLIGLIYLLIHIFASSVYTALYPICRIPGLSLGLSICRSPALSTYEGSEPPVQFDQLMSLQSKFETVLEESAGGVSLPLDMKRGEASIRDLRQVVRHSELRSKNELVLEFDGFIETARIASYDLQKFNSHVGRGVDNILATARWTKRVLNEIADRDSSVGTISAFFNDRLLAPFQRTRFTEARLLDQYIQHTRVVEDEIHRLIAEAQALLHVLQNLEDRLDVIHGIAVRDDMRAQSSKAEVLSQLWTMVGGNRGPLGKFDSQLRLLGQVNTYRQSAIAHVSGTMLKLQAMGTELEELRERVGGVGLLGGSQGVPLRVHIENIELGVERLEKGRDRAKELESEGLRKAVGSDTHERWIEGT